MFIELHMIQNFAPSNLNRDDTNTPKDCEFGGVRRARISSQCLKRAIRSASVFEQTTRVPNGMRSRWMTRNLTTALAQQKPAAQAEKVANAFALQYAGKGEIPKGNSQLRTAVLIYYSSAEIQEMVGGLLANWDAALTAVENPDDKALQEKSPIPGLVKELVKKSKGRTTAPDIALFGRMLANDPALNLDAACQVAHAISTHRVSMELDFFTAVDDIQEDEETGAGMMGTGGFNSAAFYRYSRVDLQQLQTNLSGEKALALAALEGFLRASVAAVPTGKQNSSAAFNPPVFLLAVVRPDEQGWSLANAFEKPVSAGRDGGLVVRSVAALDEYWGWLVKVFGMQNLQVFALPLAPGLALENLKGCTAATLDEWVKAVLTAVEA